MNSHIAQYAIIDHDGHIKKLLNLTTSAFEMVAAGRFESLFNDFSRSNYTINRVQGGPLKLFRQGIFCIDANRSVAVQKQLLLHHLQ